MTEAPPERLTDHIVNPAWLARHGFRLPFKPGEYQTETAWLKVNQHGIITNAEEADRSIKAELLRRELLDEHHGYYANVFLDMRRAFLADVAHAFNRLYYASEFFDCQNDGALEGLYFGVCRLMGRDAQKLVIHACTTDYRGPDSGQMERYREVIDKYREAFDTLVRSMDTARAEENKRKKQAERANS